MSGDEPLYTIYSFWLKFSIFNSFIDNTTVYLQATTPYFKCQSASHILKKSTIIYTNENMLSDTIHITVPVTTVTITPSGDNNVVYSVEGESQTCTCTTDSSRPAVWIQWYNYYYLYYSTSDNSDNHSS